MGSRSNGTNYADAARLAGNGQPASQVLDFFTRWLGDHGWRRTWLDAGTSSTISWPVRQPK